MGKAPVRHYKQFSQAKRRRPHPAPSDRVRDEDDLSRTHSKMGYDLKDNQDKRKEDRKRERRKKKKKEKDTT